MVNHLATIAILATTSSAKAKPASTNFTSLLFIAVIVAAAWFLFFRPRSKQAHQQRQLLTTLDVGDEIITGAGIYGTIVEVAPDRITIETAPGTFMTVARSTVARKVQPVVHADEDDGAPGANGSGHLEVGALQARLDGHSTDVGDDDDDHYDDDQYDGDQYDGDEIDDEADADGVDEDDEYDEDDADGDDGHEGHGADGGHEGEGGTGVQTHGGGGDQR